MKKSNWDYIIKYKVVIGIIIAWFIWHGRIGEVTMDRMTFMCFLGLGLWFLEKEWEKGEKYKTGQFVADGYHASTNNIRQDFGDWTAIRGGDMKFFGIDGKDSVCVVPREFTFDLGDNKFSLCRVERCDFSELPVEVQNWVVQEKLHESDIWLGVAPRHMEIDDPEIVVDYILSKDKGRFETMRSSLLKGGNQMIERQVGSAGRIHDTLTKGTGIGRYLKPKKEEENE